MEPTLLYFFSTLTQAFASLVAFVFVAAQTRIAWLDSKITAEKMALIFKLHPGTQNLNFYLATQSATEIINEGLSKNDEIKRMATHLKKLVEQMQNFRETIRTHVLWGIGIVMLGIVGLVLVPLIKDSQTLAWVSLLISAALAIFSAYQTAKFIYDSLKVSLKENI